jgi:hypothetical protein
MRPRCVQRSPASSSAVRRSCSILVQQGELSVGHWKPTGESLSNTTSCHCLAHSVLEPQPVGTHVKSIDRSAATLLPMGRCLIVSTGIRLATFELVSERLVGIGQEEKEHRCAGAASARSFARSRSFRLSVAASAPLGPVGDRLYHSQDPTLSHPVLCIRIRRRILYRDAT